jgi:formate dehydrogenase major subunit
VVKALKSLDLFIVQELFMTETALLADVVLPGASFLEKDGTFTNGERRIQRVQRVVEPVGNSKVDGQIIIDVMNRMGYKQADYAADTMLEEISQIVPFFKGVKWEELGDNGKQWPVKEDGTDTQILHTEEFKIGKGVFDSFDWRESAEVEANGKQFPYILTTVRELEHYNCGAMTRRTGNVEILTEDYLVINPEDAAAKNIKHGDMVCVISERGKADVRAKVSTDVKPGILSSTFHFPEIMLNNLTSDIHDSEAMCPEYKVVSVDIRKSKGEFAKV